MHDRAYRLAIAWQNVAYNQPPHPSFFLGEGMGTPPQPNIYYPGNPVTPVPTETPDTDTPTPTPTPVTDTPTPTPIQSGDCSGVPVWSPDEIYSEAGNRKNKEVAIVSYIIFDC